MSIYNSFKRLIDFSSALVGLCLLAPVLVFISIFIKFESRGPVLFRQKRVGRAGRPFHIYKFRTMRAGSERNGLPITVQKDPRITRLGTFLRRYKLDELPQLINVLRGEMSLVGPRPELEKYVTIYGEDYREILSILPGMTDFAALEFRDENERLRAAQNPEEVYIHQILPEKIKLYKKYLRQRGFSTDLSLIARTIWAVFRK